VQLKKPDEVHSHLQSDPRPSEPESGSQSESLSDNNLVESCPESFSVNEDMIFSDNESSSDEVAAERPSDCLQLNNSNSSNS